MLGLTGATCILCSDNALAGTMADPMDLARGQIVGRPMAPTKSGTANSYPTRKVLAFPRQSSF